MKVNQRSSFYLFRSLLTFFFIESGKRVTTNPRNTIMNLTSPPSSALTPTSPRLLRPRLGAARLFWGAISLRAITHLFGERALVSLPRPTRHLAPSFSPFVPVLLVALSSPVDPFRLRLLPLPFSLGFVHLWSRSRCGSPSVKQKDLLFFHGLLTRKKDGNYF